MSARAILLILAIPALLALVPFPARGGDSPGPGGAPVLSSGDPRPPVPEEALVTAGKPSPGPSPVGLKGYLLVSSLAFGLGVMIVIVRRNAIAVLMGIELMLNAAGLNFVAFSRFVARDLIDGQVITIFLIVIAAAEAAVALAIILNIYNNMNTVTVDEADELKG